MSGSGDLESRARPQQQNPLIPMMLSPPESLLVSCVLRGNFVEAHQVNDACTLCNLENSLVLAFVLMVADEVPAPPPLANTELKHLHSE